MSSKSVLKAPILEAHLNCVAGYATKYTTMARTQLVAAPMATAES
jgi:hypothetical protein